MQYSAKSIANGLLKVAQDRGQTISNMKLQKLLYFAHGFWLASTGAPLIGEVPEAWQYGPVYPSVYHEFKECGGDAINRLATEISFATGLIEPVPFPDDQVMGYLASVYNSYGSQSAIQLSRLSHLPGSPWARVREESRGAFSADIPDSYTHQYFLGWLKQPSTQAAG